MLGQLLVKICPVMYSMYKSIKIENRIRINIEMLLKILKFYAVDRLSDSWEKKILLFAIHDMRVKFLIKFFFSIISKYLNLSLC